MTQTPLPGAVAPTRDFYRGIPDLLLRSSVSADIVAWTAFLMEGTPGPDAMPGLVADPIEAETLRRVRASGIACQEAGDTPAAQATLGTALLTELSLTDDNLQDQDGFDRPLIHEMRCRLPVYLGELGRHEVLPYLVEASADFAEMVPNGSPERTVSVGVRAMDHYSQPFRAWKPGHPTNVMAWALSLGRHVNARLNAADFEDDLGIPKDRGEARSLKAARMEQLKAADALPPHGTVIVAPRFGLGIRSTETSAINRSLGEIVGKALPLVPMPKTADATKAIYDEVMATCPHAHWPTRSSLVVQGRAEFWGRDPLMLFGKPGAGKNAWVRAWAKATGRPLFVYPADTAQDASFSGTPARWATQHASVLLAAMARSGFANPIVQVDELDKAAGSRNSNSGRLVDALTSATEHETSKDWFEGLLQAGVDMSHIQIIVTVNDIDKLPEPLIDRFRLMEFYEPTGEHLPVLAPQFARAACRELHIDEAWATFDAVEYAALAEAWGKGGSLRRLKKLVRAILESRDDAPGVSRH